MDFLFKSLQVDFHTTGNPNLPGRWENSTLEINKDSMQMHVKTCKHQFDFFISAWIQTISNRFKINICLNTLSVLWWTADNAKHVYICMNRCICHMHELVQVCIHTQTTYWICAHITCTVPMCACVNLETIDCGQEHFLKSHHRPLLHLQFKELFSTQKKALRREKRRAEKK